MEGKIEETEFSVKGNEGELNNLFTEILDGLRDDIIEANSNVSLYQEAVLNETGGKEVYGSHYNEALKIKGASRDRMIKFLNIFKDRVTKKETNKALQISAQEEEVDIDTSKLNDWYSQHKKNLEKSQAPTIEIKLEDDEDGDIEE